MANSYFEMEAERAAESWRTIRAFRARPPIEFKRTLKGRRGCVFHAGLEQAQQQYSAAAQIGYESRPLNLFYGLAQAGRAVAALSPRLQGEAAWEGNAHGLHFASNYERAVGFMRAPIDVRPNDHDLFSRVSKATGLPVAHSTVQLRELLGCIPEVHARYGPFDDKLGAILSPGSSYGDPFRTGPPHALGYLFGLASRGRLTVGEAEALWAAYPALAALPTPPTRQDDPELIQLSGTPGQVTVYVNSIHGAQLRNGSWHPAGAVDYRDKPWLLPYIGTPHFEASPLTVWWLVLFTCSVMSRYDASRWTDLLRLRNSADASLLEYVLDLALDAVPAVIASALESLPSGQSW